GSPRLAGLKTLNRLEQVMARAEWQNAGIVEGLMATPAGEFVCGTMSNLFLVLNGALLTPRLTNCGVRGIMRRVVLERAAAIDITVTEATITQATLESADEMFLTNSLIGIWPVREYAGRVYSPGAVTRQLMAALAAVGVEECAP
nr:aminotransferase class IV [Gammaproteobacteria bacterium]